GVGGDAAAPVCMTDELDETTFPAWRDAIAAHAGDAAAPRSYPGYPRHPLPALRRRRFGAALDHVLASRRSAVALGDEGPRAEVHRRVLGLADGVTGEHDRGEVP